MIWFSMFTQYLHHRAKTQLAIRNHFYSEIACEFYKQLQRMASNTWN